MCRQFSTLPYEIQALGIAFFFIPRPLVSVALAVYEGSMGKGACIRDDFERLKRKLH